MSDEVKIPLPKSLQEIVGALLFASSSPLTAGELREAVRAVEPAESDNREIFDIYRTCTTKEIDEALRGLEKALEVAGCGFSLVCTGGTYRLQTVPATGRYVRAMLKLDRPSRLGRASLETLAIVAYRQPLTKGEIEEIRGVDVSGNLKTLVDLQLVRLVGKSELPGHPFLYGTTPMFLEHFGLASLQQLNELDPTLQRSNPREKAALYRKPVEKKVDEPTPETAVEPQAADAAAEASADEIAAEAEEATVPEAGVEAPVGEGSGEPAPAQDDDDDFFIDDTPDEFDEEEDEDDEEDEGEEEESAEGEGVEDDEGK